MTYASAPAPLSQWFKTAMRLAFLRWVPAIAQRFTAAQFALVWLGVVVMELVLSRLLTASPADFDAQGWVIRWAPDALLALFVWLAFDAAGRDQPPQNGRVGTAIGLLFLAEIPLSLLVYAVAFASAADASPALVLAWAWAQFAVYWLCLVWGVLIALRVYRLLGMPWARAMTLVAVSTATMLGAQAYFAAQSWTSHAPEPESAPRMQLTQALFESQADLLQTQLQNLKPQRPSHTDVYGVIYAPYASEGVFLKEARMVQDVLNTQFAAAGRTVALVNSVQTTATLAWATPANLQRTIAAMASKMDKNQDVLLLYLTSHGARDFQLASDHWPLKVDPLTPQMLAQYLQDAGIKYRVVAVSACYSGGWIEPLQADSALVMTAADATHTSYGCGMRSELTFFGRALFDEALRSTRSFTQAFATAVPIIKKREEVAGKNDGFSNPQISVGAAIAPVLTQLATQAPATTTP